MVFKEGKAQFRVLDDPQIFYNPEGRLARTIGILSLRAISKKLKEPMLVADSFAGVGVRSFRYLLEVKNVKKVYLNDAAPRAVSISKINAKELNLTHRINFSQLEANRFFWEINRKEIFPHFLDIDTFGSPMPYIDSAFFAVRIPGYIYVTSTDLAPLCGVRARAALRHYGAFGARLYLCHETGLRTVLWSILASGGRHGFTSTPLLSFFDGHAFRLLLYIERGKRDFPAENVGFVIVDNMTKEVGFVHGINLYDVRGLIKGSSVFIGPLWIGKLHDKDFLKSLLLEIEYYRDEEPKEAEEIKKFLGLCLNEIDFPPYFFSVHLASKILKISPPPVKVVVKALKENGWRAAQTHFDSLGVKTDAPFLSFLSAVKEGARSAKRFGHP